MAFSDDQDTRRVLRQQDASVRRPYSSPRVVCLGDLREVTLGGPSGTGDSGGGGPLIQRPPG